MPVQIRPATVESFITDGKIKLPRFQRKLVWTPEKNFKLAISVFKGYPLGVVVLRTESIDETKTTEFRKLLLDGRQRWNALRQMHNPEAIYTWARGPLEIKQSDSETDLADKYWSYVDSYFGEDPSLSSGVEAELIPPPTTEDVAPPEREEEAPQDVTEPRLTAAAVSDPKRPRGLVDLLELILVVHPKRGNRSELTKTFDFRPEVESTFVKPDPVTRRDVVDSESLLEWIDSRKRLSNSKDKPFPPPQSEFCDWLAEGARLKGSRERLEQRVNDRWTRIDRILDAIDSLYTRLSETYIGYIELHDTDAGDDMKIFEIINREGTQLTSEQILSARPSWNLPVADPDITIRQDKDRLYNEIGVSYPDVVRWDQAATLLDRLKIPFILGVD